MSSSLDYVQANNKESNQAQDVRFCRGSDIGSDYFLVQTKAIMLATYRNVNNKKVKLKNTFLNLLVKRR